MGVGTETPRSVEGGDAVDQFKRTTTPDTYTPAAFVGWADIARSEAEMAPALSALEDVLANAHGDVDALADALTVKGAGQVVAALFSVTRVAGFVGQRELFARDIASPREARKVAELLDSLGWWTYFPSGSALSPPLRV